ncbi:hypothetical protein RRG08_029677 [Elysia crispata]|uniref:Uncharacterized protein n=1 Tax=Elysia crispata TaxID=231223 RepID=A0AAE1BD51_9GAST|nr:hypothetical protein RRG08_029677 [Elysia crispata]
MSITGIYSQDVYRQRELVKKEKRLAESHVIAQLCTESRWPYTATLTPQQITCMRDSYYGHRLLPTALKQTGAYDRIYQPEEGWDQRARMPSRHFLEPLQISARQEERHRNPVVCANSVYGHRAKSFYDFQSKENRKISCTKNFLFKSGCSLPPLPRRN